MAKGSLARTGSRDRTICGNSNNLTDKYDMWFRAWDLVEQGDIWRIEDAGRTDDGQPLFALCGAPCDRPEPGRAS